MILVGSDGERITLGEEESGGGGILVPSPGPPGKDSTVPGPAGRSVDGISVSGDSLVFDMSQGPDIILPVPAIADANDAAERAEGAAKLAVETAAGIQDVAEDAAQVAQDRLAVESAASAVAADRGTVTDALDVVVTARGDVEQIEADLHQTKTSIENTVNLVDQTLEQYGAQFVAERELSQQAVTDATLQAQRAEDAAEDIIAGAVLDDSITTPKLVDEAVTKAKTSPGVQTSLDKADMSVQEGDSRLTDARPPTTHPHVVTDVTGLQNALDGKSNTGHPHGAADITDATTVGRTVMKAADAAAARTAIGAPASNDSRFSDTRTPSAGTVPYDTTLPGAGETSARAVGYNDCALGIKLQRAVTFTSATFRCLTADTSGNLVVELRKNGASVSGTSTTIAAANQVAGATSTGTWAFAAGDVLTVYVASIGVTPGKGLVVDLKGLA